MIPTRMRASGYARQVIVRDEVDLVLLDERLVDDPGRVAHHLVHPAAVRHRLVPLLVRHHRLALVLVRQRVVADANQQVRVGETGGCACQRGGGSRSAEGVAPTV